MRYAAARYEKDFRDAAYYIYVTDSLYYSGQGKCLTMKYTDVIDTSRKKKDKRTADEIALDVITRCGLVVE